MGIISYVGCCKIGHITPVLFLGYPYVHQKLEAKMSSTLGMVFTFECFECTLHGRSWLELSRTIMGTLIPYTIEY